MHFLHSGSLPKLHLICYFLSFPAHQQRKHFAAAINKNDTQLEFQADAVLESVLLLLILLFC